ncbi:MAG: hypothetical protein EOM45_14690, partial [Clostridia bacterium]|nr:hypothetical protein [Clostridia bacterium]
MTKQEVLEVITKASNNDMALTRYDILGEFFVTSTSENLKQLTGILRELKSEGLICVCQIQGADNHFRGRGY